MDCKLKLGQLVDRHFDALSAKYERVETSKLLSSGITMIAGGNIKTTTPTPCCGRIDYVQALLNDVGTELIFKFIIMKNLVILLVVFSVFVTSDIYAQSDTSKVETVIYQSPDFPEFKAISVVNYFDYSSVYVHWSESDFNIDRVEVYELNQLIDHETVVDREAFLENLNNDKYYTIVLKENGSIINTKKFNTFSSDNNIEVSKALYNVLTKAGRKEKYEDALCDALLTADEIGKR